MSFASVDSSTTRCAPLVRDQSWIEQELEYLWDNHFADVPLVNRVAVRFVGTWRSRLGLITLSEDEHTTYICLNTLLRLPEVPYYVPSITLAHELVHYAHGFGSPLPRKYRYPHRGRIVERELSRRGLRAEYDLYDDWVYTHWYNFYPRFIGRLHPAWDPLRNGGQGVRSPLAASDPLRNGGRGG
ncbi:MAG: hypothetical protein HYY04_00490 [Chloroflexi bacterium]|nr:hypothetical protein [Chloroflexota bacterium]